MIAFLLLPCLLASDTSRYVAKLNELSYRTGGRPEFMDEDAKISYEIEARDAIDRDPLNMDRHLDLARFIESVKEDYNGADQVYQTALRLDPLSVTARSGYANFLLVRRGNVPAAGIQFRSALTHAKDYHPSDIPFIASKYGLYLAKYESMANAEEMLQRLHLATAAPYVDLADFAFANSRDPTIADEYYRKALAIDGDDIAANLRYARFLEKGRGKHDDAERHLLHALELKRDTETLSAYSEFIRGVRKDYSTYVTLAKEGHAADPTHPAWSEIKMWLDADGPMSNCFGGAVSQDIARFLACVLVKIRFEDWTRGAMLTSVFGLILGRGSSALNSE